jgi:microtubule-associated protein-like 6
MLLVGSKDHKITIFSKDLQQQVKINLDEVLKQAIDPEVRALTLNPETRTIVVGTFGSEIHELTTKDNKINISTKYTSSRAYIKAHSAPNMIGSNETWGLACFQSEPDLFATCSDDGTLRIWSIS